ncbi:hypothetical protein B0H10DRAFT_1794203, partial [Mycena sp. CBHHK59/15]
IENYSRDTKEVLRLIRSHAGCPPFTETGWKNLLEGNYVDLDQMSDELYKHKITNQGEWTTAWLAFEHCVNFAFQDRGQELTTYFQYIQGLFAQTSADHAHNVIGCDEAIQTFIGSSRQHLFDNISFFGQFE